MVDPAKLEDTEYLQKLTRKLLEHRVVTSCVICVNFDSGREVCRLYDARPPASVIVTGCAQWDSGPFA